MLCSTKKKYTDMTKPLIHDLECLECPACGNKGIKKNVCLDHIEYMCSGKQVHKFWTIDGVIHTLTPLKNSRTYQSTREISMGESTCV